MPIRSRFWFAVVVGCVVVQLAAALLLEKSFFLAALSDFVQMALLASGMLAVFPHALKTSGRLRMFWVLMTLGVAFWLAYQVLWTYFEVVLRTDVPDLFSGDIVLFLHLVPMIAALALRPHSGQDEYSARLGGLDFALLAMAWVYLWAIMILPWQYAKADVFTYNQNFNTVYLVEKLTLICALVAAWASTKNEWRFTYAHLLGATFLYASSSYVANWAIGRNVYYSGSVYDVPLTAAMAWFTYIGLSPSSEKLEPGTEVVSTTYGVWMARVGMGSVMALPVFGTWAFYESGVPGQVRSFRIVLTLLTALAMGAMVFVRQHLLDRELLQLLGSSQQAVEDLRILQAQLTESEKLASMGKLVGGVAHELNNPITAMLGFSDILQDTQLGPEQRALAERIGQRVRQTQALVSSLLSLVRSSPGTRNAVDLNTLARTALKLGEAHLKALKLKQSLDLAPMLPAVSGDSNQLLQVCTQMINSVLYSGPVEGALLLSTRLQQAMVVLEVTHRSEGKGQPKPSTEQREQLGNVLTVCLNIVRQHGGHLNLATDEEGNVTATLKLPVTAAAVKPVSAAALPATPPARSFV